MARVIITATVNNVAAWEKSFRTHGALFRSQPGESPYLIGSTNSNDVAVSAVVADGDIDAYIESLQSKETTDAMAADGVQRESVKVFVLDREFKF
jgi:hypothetical protein